MKKRQKIINEIEKLNNSIYIHPQPLHYYSFCICNHELYIRQDRMSTNLVNITWKKFLKIVDFDYWFVSLEYDEIFLTTFN